jgi:hypothetical protein
MVTQIESARGLREAEVVASVPALGAQNIARTCITTNADDIVQRRSRCTQGAVQWAAVGATPEPRATGAGA